MDDICIGRFGVKTGVGETRSPGSLMNAREGKTRKPFEKCGGWFKKVKQKPNVGGETLRESMRLNGFKKAGTAGEGRPTVVRVPKELEGSIKL